MAYGNKSPDKWFVCPNPTCKEPLQVQEKFCYLCGHPAVEMREIKQ